MMSQRGARGLGQLGQLGPLGQLGAAGAAAGLEPTGLERGGWWAGPLCSCPTRTIICTNPGLRPRSQSSCLRTKASVQAANSSSRSAAAGCKLRKREPRKTLVSCPDNSHHHNTPSLRRHRQRITTATMSWLGVVPFKKFPTPVCTSIDPRPRVLFVGVCCGRLTLPIDPIEPMHPPDQD